MNTKLLHSLINFLNTQYDMKFNKRVIDTSKQVSFLIVFYDKIFIYILCFTAIVILE